MKTVCGASVKIAFVFSFLLLAIVQPIHAAPAGTIFLEDFNGRDHINRDPQGGKLTLADGIATLQDLRKGQDLNDVTPPTWTVNCKGDAPANSYLEIRVKASANVMYWVDLVNQKNQSIATIELQEGTGDWQIRRARFEGQFGSAGDDVFIRVKRSDDKSDDSVQIDYIAVVKGSASPATQTAAPATENLALAKRECMVLSSSFQDVTDHYTDRLIDGKTNTSWRSFPSIKGPHWVEMRWEYPIQINQLIFRPAASDAPSKIEIQIPEKAGWKKIKTISPPPVWPDADVSEMIEPVTTNRLRVSMGDAEPTAVALSEIEVYGPPQPLVWKLRPYWKANYIWYPEPDKQIKAEPRYFRTTFDVTDLEKVTSAQLQVRSNDGYVGYINGIEVAAGSVVVRPVDVKASLRKGKNCIAFEARSAKDPGWALMTLLAQLNINAGDADQVIGTDTTWRCNQSVSEGWKLPDFNDGAWAHAFICATPPDEPWGRIPYFDVSDTRPVRVVKPVSLNARAGETTTVELQLQLASVPGQDLMLILKAGEVEINSDRSNYVVSQATTVVPKSAWQSDGRANVKVSLSLPEYSPAMRVPLRISILGTEKAQNFRIVSDDTSLAADSVGTISIERPAKAAASDKQVGAKLESSDGACRIKIGSQNYNPFLWALQTPSLDRYGAYSGAGVHLYHLQIYPYRIDHAVDYDKTHFAFIDQHIRHLLAIDPSAKVLVEMDVRDSSAWAEAHPDERLVTAQGSKKSASMASAEYAKDISDYVRRLVRFMQGKPYRDSVIGYIPEIAEPESAMGGADQNAFQTDRLKLNIGDYNPQAIAKFRQFLRRKYDDSSTRLRAAWKDDAVDFDTASPKLEDLTREGDHGGMFRDPTLGRMPFDYFEFLSTLVPNFVEENIAKVIKEESDGKALVGFYYGYVVETLRSCNNPGALLQGNHFQFDKVIDSPVFDFFMSPLQYEHRMAGDRMFSFQPMDSIRLHKKLYIAEEDLRTHVSGLTSYGRQRSEQESVAVLKNHLGTAVIKGTGAWMADWSSGAGHSRTAVPFFKDPAILSTISSLKKLYDSTANQPRSSSTQVAVFVSPKTMYYHDVSYASVLYKNLISEMLYTQMPYIGAPFDTYSIEDVDKAQVQDQYKLYIFLNAFFMDDAQREAVEKLKRDGKTLLFFYAPGYVSNERGLQASDVARVSGFAVDLNFDKQIQTCVTENSDHPLLKGIAPGTEYTATGFDYAPETAKLHPTAFGPRFNITDASAVPLARFADKSVALAARDFGKWKSVYASVPYLDTQALRNIAAWAGVHLYTDERIVVEASDQFVLLHSGFDRDRKLKLHLPQMVDVEDALTGEAVAKQSQEVTVSLPRSTTMIYRLKKECGVK